ncbi:hypothetical protein QCA50_011821 [Cerrena zonata]|uniref:Uncharacterized protein n=1 Tax=Cerrena zonata TaxID=2478898 RepID=A0AAW0FVR3_9APHY
MHRPRGTEEIASLVSGAGMEFVSSKRRLSSCALVLLEATTSKREFGLEGNGGGGLRKRPTLQATPLNASGLRTSRLNHFTGPSLIQAHTLLFSSPWNVFVINKMIVCPISPLNHDNETATGLTSHSINIFFCPTLPPTSLSLDSSPFYSRTED